MKTRALPSVDAVLASATGTELTARYPRPSIVEAVRDVLADERRARRGEASTADDALSIDGIVAATERWLAKALHPDLPRVVNATGVVLHTGLGRAPLAARAVEALVRAATEPCALELDLESGERGLRDDAVGESLAALTGAEASLVVNNNAAALLLIVDTLAARREVVVSRGELIEIGGAFRLPEVLARGGAILREVGTTNRTRIADYQAVLSRRTAMLLRAHPSNFRIEGFTERPERAELVRLGRAHGIPLVEDLGSGALIDLATIGLAHEPTPAEAIQAGVDLVTFSGDKLLGGPQAGIVVGKQALVEKMQENPLKRALRADKLVLAALRATLSLYRSSLDLRNDLPVLGLLARDARTLQALADEALSLLGQALPTAFHLETVPSEAEVGSGAQPVAKLASRAIAVTREGWPPHRLAALFRRGTPSIIGRIHQGRFLLDVRAVVRSEDLVPRGIDGSWA